MPERILITGGGGFLGLPLCDRLRELGDEVLSVSRHSGVDVSDWNHVSSVERCDVVYHLAAVAGVDEALARPRESYTTNVLGTLHILEYCRIRRARRLVFASSYVYGQPKYLPVDEDHPLSPGNPYAQSKIIGETLCRQYYEDYGVSVVILRVFNPYGPRQRGSFLIPTVLNQLQRQGKVVLRDQAPRRDFVFVQDVVDAFTMAGSYAGSEFAIFNVASGKSYSVSEIVGMIQNIHGQPFEVVYTGPSRPFEIPDCVGGVERSKRNLGWQAKTDIDNGLRQTVEAWAW
jgi:UDP-glucose 4-epimerase